MALTPEDKEMMTPKKKGPKVKNDKETDPESAPILKGITPVTNRTPEEKAEMKKGYDRKYGKIRLDKVKAVRFKPEILAIAQMYVTPDKSFNALIQEAILEYKNLYPITK